MHDRIMQICTYDLFQFAYIPSWYEQLYELSQNGRTGAMAV